MGEASPGLPSQQAQAPRQPNPPSTSHLSVVAYEPVWAIGTGRTPTTAQVAEVHAEIRRDLLARFDEGAGFRILYGGSVKPDNAAELMAVADVDGALEIGRAHV